MQILITVALWSVAAIQTPALGRAHHAVRSGVGPGGDRRRHHRRRGDRPRAAPRDRRAGDRPRRRHLGAFRARSSGAADLAAAAPLGAPRAGGRRARRLPSSSRLRDDGGRSVRQRAAGPRGTRACVGAGAVDTAARAPASGGAGPGVSPRHVGPVAPRSRRRVILDRRRPAGLRRPDPKRRRRSAAKHAQRNRERYPCRIRFATEDPRIQQAVLPVQSLADLDLGVLHRARAADLRSVRARLRRSAWRCGWRRSSSAPASPACAARCRASSPTPYILRFNEDRPNPLYRRVCYTFAWSEVVSLRACSTSPGSSTRSCTGTWRMRHFYDVGYLPIAGTVLAAGRARAGCRASGDRPKARARSAATSTDRSGPSASRSRCCGCSGKSCPAPPRAMP